MAGHPIRSTRVRQLLELVGETGELAPPQRRQHVVEGASRLFGASAVVMVTVQEYFVDGQNRVVSLASTGWTGRERNAYVATIAASVCGDPALRHLGRMAGARTHRRRDLLSDREWYATPWVCEAHRSAHLDDGLYSARPVDGGTLTEGIGLHRSWGDRAFSDEDRELLHLLSLEGRRLFRARKLAILDEVGRSLPRRQAQTLEWLCRGASKKQIAVELGVSLNTVNSYVKALYRFFGVTTRAELLVRCLGDARSDPAGHDPVQ